MRGLSDRVTRWETNFIAALMAAMVIVSFTQVVARYVFNSGWGGALAFTRILFAWLILFGMAYGIKIGTHLGVDVFVRMLPRRGFKLLAMFGALCGILYAVILLHSDWLQYLGINTRGGAIDYWLRMFKIGVGLEDLLYPEWMQEHLGMQERVQRWIAYLMLPIGLALLAFRSLEALIQIARGKRETIIASHEAEDLVAENRGAAAGPAPVSGERQGEPSSR